MPARSRAARNPEILFYDGSCGVCRRSVMFVLIRDRARNPLLYAPLDGDTFENLVPKRERADLPDGIVLLTAEGSLLTRSTAALHVARRLGPPWGFCAAVAGIFPRPLRDCVYGALARVRKTVPGWITGQCPTVPTALRHRFLD